jgi:hypothetical protein
MRIRGSVAVYLLPGMKVKISAPEQFIQAGEHEWQGASGGYKNLTLQNGFAVEDEDVGKITKVYTDEPSVEYTHNKFAQNRILFFNRVGEQSYVDVISVPIHDHSSIVTGGPAYGTYFTDDELHEKSNEGEDI